MGAERSAGARLVGLISGGVVGRGVAWAVGGAGGGVGAGTRAAGWTLGGLDPRPFDGASCAAEGAGVTVAATAPPGPPDLAAAARTAVGAGGGLTTLAAPAAGVLATRAAAVVAAAAAGIGLPAGRASAVAWGEPKTTGDARPRTTASIVRSGVG